MINFPNLNFGYGDVIQCSDGQNDAVRQTIICSILPEQSGEDFVIHLCFCQIDGQGVITTFGDNNPDTHMLKAYGLARVIRCTARQVLPLAQFIEEKPQFIPFLYPVLEALELAHLLPEQPAPSALKSL